MLNTTSEPVEVPVEGELLLTTVDGATVADGTVTLPPASTVWLRAMA
ncbi:MAG: hypothetical protein LC713_04280 [Actinobacteria bacterium]|nr:hypothetical protein [Actinomycetota bacterium]